MLIAFLCLFMNVHFFAFLRSFISLTFWELSFLCLFENLQHLPLHSNWLLLSTFKLRQLVQTFWTFKSSFNAKFWNSLCQIFKVCAVTFFNQWNFVPSIGYSISNFVLSFKFKIFMSLFHCLIRWHLPFNDIRPKKN